MLAVAIASFSSFKGCVTKILHPQKPTQPHSIGIGSHVIGTGFVTLHITLLRESTIKNFYTRLAKKVKILYG